MCGSCISCFIFLFSHWTHRNFSACILPSYIATKRHVQIPLDTGHVEVRYINILAPLRYSGANCDETKTERNTGGNMNQQKIKNAPERKFRAGAIAATVWKN